jgi:hypothetical protein
MNANLVKAAVAVVLALAVAGCSTLDVNGSSETSGASQLPPFDFGPSTGG